jgi:hypothetical protein
MRHDVRDGLAGGPDGVVAVRGFTDDGDVGFGVEQGAESGADQALVVGQDDADHCGPP